MVRVSHRAEGQRGSPLRRRWGACDFDSALDGWGRFAGVTQAVGRPPRYLQQLFARHGMTVSGWIRERGLEQTRETLVDPARAEAGSLQITPAHGFTDHSHFTRAFRAACGETPSACGAHSAAVTGGLTPSHDVRDGGTYRRVGGITPDPGSS